MKPALGKAKKMTGILMGAERIVQHGKSFILVVPEVSVYIPSMSDSQISAGRRMEAGYNVNFRIPNDALTDGFAPHTFPLYGVSITTPDNLNVIVMEYAGHTWRLPKVRPISKSVTVPVTTLSPEDSEDIKCFTKVSTCNSFAEFLDVFDHDDEAHVPDFLSTQRVEGHMKKHFELICRNRKEAMTLHRAHGHPNNRTLLFNLEAQGLPNKHLKRCILAVSCDAYQAAIGKRDNKTSTVALSKRQAIAQQKKTEKAHHKFIAQQKSILIFLLIPPSTRICWTSVLLLTQWTPPPLSLNRWHVYMNSQRQMTVLITRLLNLPSLFM